MAYTTPRTWTDGETVTAALLNLHLRDQFDAIAAAYTSYTPVLRSTTTTVTTSATLGRFVQIGKWVRGYGSVTLSATPAAGTMNVSLPVAGLAASVGVPIGEAVLGRATTLYYGVTGIISSVGGTTGGHLAFGYQTALATNTAPATWASGDVFQFAFAYEAA